MEILMLIVLLGIVGFQIYLLKCVKSYKKGSLKRELTYEEKKKQEKLRKNFENLMNYGYNDALKKKE